MTTDDHLRELLMPVIWQLSVQLAAAKADIDALNELVKQQQAELSALQDKAV